MLAVFISMITDCNAIKVKITKYHLKKENDLALDKNHRYNILGFRSSDQKVFWISESEFCKRYSFFFPISILVKGTKIFWWSIWLRMDFNTYY